MKKIVVVTNTRDWDSDLEDIQLVSARSYLTDPKFTEIKNARVFNLCRQYRYQSTGYYVSLLAEARGQKAIPSVTTIQDFKSQTIIKSLSEEIDDLIQKSLRKIKSKTFVLSIYFGRNLAQQHESLARNLYNLFQAPFLRATFKLHKKWVLQNISPISVIDISENHKAFVRESAMLYFAKKRYHKARFTKTIYDLAILVNPEEKVPPSDKKALEKFAEAGEKLGFYVDFLTREDYSRLLEFDALFIRETTSVNHHTYRFSRRAHAEGMVVIDDPVSILRCANKVYLAEILASNKIPTPNTMIIHKDNAARVPQTLGFPCVLKIPDSSFSQGVVKVSDEEELKTKLAEMLSRSDLIIGQSFTPTDYDWRIGILDRKPLYACRYFMARNHWQIYNWGEKKNQTGLSEALPISLVPPPVLETALKAANIIGDGFYGVDLKAINGKVLVIEVNDNPSIDSGCEDQVLRDKLYYTVLESIKRQIENAKT